MKRPVFPTTLSIPSYDIGKYVGLRTYQYPLVKFVSFDPRGNYDHIKSVRSTSQLPVS